MICDNETNFNSRIAPSTSFDHRIIKTLRLKDMKPLKLGQSRDFLRIDAILESAYEPEGMKRLKEQEEDLEKQGNKGLIHMFGYKHDKALKFYGSLLRCMRDCYESRFEQLNIDMNFFLLLKNELSLAFLRN